MENLTSWFNVTLNSLQSFGVSLMGALPSIIGAILIILFGWLIAKLLSRITNKILNVIKLDKRVFKLNNKQIIDEEIIKKASPSLIISKFVYWTILLLFFISASDILGWNAVSTEISKLINFIPKIFIAIIIFVIGFYIASIIKNAIKTGLKTMGIEYGNLLGNIAFYIVLVIISITAINQIGVDTTLITTNIVIILIAILATISISFGIASKDFLVNILSTHYSKTNFKVGQTIKVIGTVGEIEKMDKIQVVLKTKEGKVVLPAKELISNKVEIIEK